MKIGQSLNYFAKKPARFIQVKGLILSFLNDMAALTNHKHQQDHLEQPKFQIRLIPERVRLKTLL